jgi:hypothetical protein
MSLRALETRTPENKKGDCSPFLPIAFVAWSYPWTSASDGEDDGQDDADYKQDPCDVRRGSGDPGEAEHRCDDRDNQECKRPIKHKELLFRVDFQYCTFNLSEAYLVPNSKSPRTLVKLPLPPCGSVVMRKILPVLRAIYARL